MQVEFTNVVCQIDRGTRKTILWPESDGIDRDLIEHLLGPDCPLNGLVTHSIGRGTMVVIDEEKRQGSEIEAGKGVRVDSEAHQDADGYKYRIAFVPSGKSIKVGDTIVTSLR